MRFLPVFLDLRTGVVLLVGAGDLARVKLRVLTAAGARVRWYATDGHYDVSFLQADDAARIERAEGDPLAADLSGVIAILCAGAGDVGIAMSVRAMKSGAIEFLTKPLHEQELLDAIHVGIERDRTRRQEAKVVAELQGRFDSLTPREREILTLVIIGGRNKQIAAQAKLSEMAVKVHRSQVMRKMGAKSLVDLVRMADKLGVSTRKA